MGDGTPAYLTAKGDMHHLFPAWYTANTQRSNHPYGETACVVISGVTSTCDWQDPGDKDEPSHLGPPVDPAYGFDPVFDVRPERRGDVARAWFSVCVRYDLWIDDRLETTLRAWHAEDPPSPREIDRNTGVEAWQLKRNSFVDRPGYVEHIANF